MAEQRQRDASVASASSSPMRVTSTSLTHLVDLSPDAVIIVDQAGHHHGE